MSRPCSALLLVLGVASTGVAQAPSTTWTLTLGEYTLYGHTTYDPTVTLVPRLVHDTVHGLDSARTIDSVRAARPQQTGFAAGLSAWPTESYCGGMMTGTMQQVDPKAVLGRLQLAARCGMRVVLVPPRRLLTANREPAGRFSVDSAKRFTDLYAAALPPDTLRKYRSTILGLNLADDYGCIQCWGGRAITQAEITEWAAYARTRLPGIPLGVRVTPDWVAAHPKLAAELDYTWAQYATRKGDAKTYYDRAATQAAQLGLRVVMGVNVEHCYEGDSAPCSPADLERFGTLALSHPASCAFINWRYDETTWEQPEIRSVWEKLSRSARARPAQECRRPAAEGTTVARTAVPWLPGM